MSTWSPPGERQHALRPSIVDFMTDGSLPRALDAIGRLAGARISLHDPDAKRIVAADGEPPWTLVDDPPSPGSVSIPLLVADIHVGDIHTESTDDAIVDVLTRLAHTAVEFCQQQIQLEHRVRELTLLFRLTSLLARAADVDDVLSIALDSALDILRLDAGSIVLFEADADGIASSDREEDLVLKAARNLSTDWLSSSAPLSRDRLFDRLALEGRIVVSEDLQNDPRILDRRRVKRERLGAAIHAGLVIAGRPIGVARLYSRSPRRFVETEKRLLRSIAQQAALAVEQARLLEIKQHERQVQRQLDLAANIQRHMMPRAVPSRPGIDLAARSRPSLELGGDFYDVFEIGDTIGFAVGDAVGKGIPAALLIATVRASLRSHTSDHEGPAEMLTRVNRAMARDAQPGEFATIVCATIDPKSRILTAATAGHDPLLLARRDRGRVQITDLQITGLVAGIDPTEHYEPVSVTLRPGDVVIAYSDGVPDTLDFNTRRFTKARLRDTIADLLDSEPGADAQRIVQHIFWSLRQHAGLALQADDQTIVVLRIQDP